MELLDEVGAAARSINRIARASSVSVSIRAFVERHSTLKMLALAFLLLIGVTLVADGLGHQVPKGHIYFSMAFSLGVEMLNLRMRRKRQLVELHQPYR